MRNKGFTLVETILGLFLLGLVTITIFPIIQGSYGKFYRNDVKLQMMNTAEMTLERLKAFNRSSTEDLYICNTKVSDIIDDFSSKGDTTLTLLEKIDDENYSVEIKKTDKNEKLWRVRVKVSCIKGEKYEDIIYKALISKK